MPSLSASFDRADIIIGAPELFVALSSSKPWILPLEAPSPSLVGELISETGSVRCLTETCGLVAEPRMTPSRHGMAV
jgi:hypothetical protein